MNEPPTYPVIITAFVGEGEDRQVLFRREGTAFFRSRFQYWPSRVAYALGDAPSERDIDGVMSVLMAVYNHEDGEALIAVSGRVFDCVVEIPGHDTALSGEFTVLTWESDYTDERRRPTTLKRAWAASASMFRVMEPVGGDMNMRPFTRNRNQYTPNVRSCSTESGWDSTERQVNASRLCKRSLVRSSRNLAPLPG